MIIYFFSKLLCTLPLYKYNLLYLDATRNVETCLIIKLLIIKLLRLPIYTVSKELFLMEEILDEIQLLLSLLFYQFLKSNQFLWGYQNRFSLYFHPAPTTWRNRIECCLVHVETCLSVWIYLIILLYSNFIKVLKSWTTTSVLIEPQEEQLNDAIRISILLIIQGEATQNYNKTIRPERKKMRIPKWTLF